LIHAEGEDENGTNHEADMRITLDVEKENHLLEITRLILTPAEFSCTKKNVQLATSIINTGNEDEEDVTIQVLNTDLGVDIQDIIDEITAEPNEDESRYAKTFSFSVPANTEAGSYPITLKATYNDGRKKTEEVATLTVNECLPAKTTTPPSNGQTEESGEEVQVITGRTASPVVQQPSPDTIVTQEGFLSSDSFVVGVIIAEIVIVIAGVLLVASLFRRRG